MTRIYFENIFCLTPFASTSKANASASPLTSDVGIKVALGDSGTPIHNLCYVVKFSHLAITDGPETTQVVIFARPCGLGDKTLNLIVARLTPHPPPTQASSPRLPRPDDPTPRKPPIFYTGDGGMNVAKREFKRVGSALNPFGVNAKRRKVVSSNGTVLADLGSGVRLGPGKPSGRGNEMFKVPEVPQHGKTTAKGKGKHVETEKDVFGSTGIDPEPLPQSSSKGKRKRGIDKDRGHCEDAVEMERANKDVRFCSIP